MVVGGWHASYLPDSALENPEIDYAIMGEGERAMVELATQLTNGADQQTIAKIPGVACRLDGKISKTPPILIEDIDSIPYPARHLLDMNFYDRKIGYLKAKPVDVMHVMRGCPYSCNYCETKKLWGMKCRAFSPERVIGELKYMKEKFGSKGIYFIDDNFTINKERTIELCHR